MPELPRDPSPAVAIADAAKLAVAIATANLTASRIHAERLWALTTGWRT